MAHVRLRELLFQIVFLLLAGGILGSSLGIATAQDRSSGALNTDCAARCAANGYDGEFCGSVCWVPDPASSAEADRVDWTCFERCRVQGGRARSCFDSCRHY
jgi:hypothetical protein